LPLDAWHARLFQAQAKVWNARGLTALAVWIPESAYDPLQLITENPVPQRVARSAEVSAMLGETRSAAVGVANTHSQSAEIRVSIEGLPGGTNPDYIQVRHTVW